MFLDGVGDVDKDDIAVDISPHSIDVRVKNLNETNYVYHIPRLYDKIIPCDSVRVSSSPRSQHLKRACTGFLVELKHRTRADLAASQFWRVRANRIHLKLYKATDEMWLQL